MLTIIFFIPAMARNNYTSAYPFNFQPANAGRFSWIRRLRLVFAAYEYVEDHQGAPGVFRRQIMVEWATFFTDNKYSKQFSYITFPSLEDLTLDFVEWNLGPDEAIMVSLGSITYLSY